MVYKGKSAIRCHLYIVEGLRASMIDNKNWVDNSSLASLHDVFAVQIHLISKRIVRS